MLLAIFPGDHVFTYKDLNIVKPVADIHFHPHDNFIAFCCYGNGEPVIIYSYDPKGMTKFVIVIDVVRTVFGIFITLYGIAIAVYGAPLIVL